jgi:tetratricopeptide (TPR) repeat protein
MDLYPQAERELGDALAIQRRIAAENPQAFRPDLADLLTESGVLQMVRRQNERCDSTVREALAIQRELLHTDPAKYTKAAVFSLTLLGRVQCDMDRCDNGEALYLEALSMYRSGPTPNAPCEEYGALLNAMALLQRRKGAETEALDYTREALAVARQMAAANPDANATHYANTLHNAASLQRAVRQLDSAIATELQAIAIVEQRMEKNPRHCTALLVTFLRGLSYHYYDQKRYGEAAKAARRSLAITRILAEDDPAAHSGELLEQLYAVASALWNDGQYDSADVYYLESLDRARKLAASDSANFRFTLPLALSLVAYDTHRERLQRSIALSLEALPLFRRLITEEPALQQHYLACCTRLSRYLIFAGRFVEAEAAVQEGVGLAGSPRWAVKNLAHSLLYQGKYELAKPFYEELRDIVTGDGTAIRDIMLADFDEFERAGITHPDVARVRALLTGKPESE